MSLLLRFGVVDVPEEILKILLDSDIDVDGDVDGLDLHGCHLHLVAGAAGTLRKEQEGQNQEWDSHVNLRL